MLFSHTDADIAEMLYAIRYSKERRQLGMNEVQYLDYLINRK